MKARDAAPSLSPSMGEVLGRRLRRLPLSRRAARVDLSHKGRVGLHSQCAHASLSPSPLMGEGLGRG